MVKRLDKKGRKPILQLEDSTKNSSLQATSSSGASTSGLRGLIQYDDSDNENGVEDSDSCVTSAGETKKIDLEVADFLKEIDALTEGQDTSEAEAKEEDQQDTQAQPVESYAVKNNNGDTVSNSAADHHQELVSAGQTSAWQQCYDESSGYTYFWNMQTNQVTWECPEELLESKAAKSTTSNHTGNLNEAGTSQEGNGCRHLPLKKQPHRTRSRTEVGKIIPISYFDQSTTSDSSDEDNSCSEPSHKRKRKSLPQYGPNLPFVPNASSSDIAIQPPNGLQSCDDMNSAESHSEVVYGPQLPDTDMSSTHEQPLHECDILAPSSSDQADRTLTNGISSPLDLSHSLDRDTCDQSNICESSDSVREASRMDVTLSVDQLVESRSSPLIQVRNISESVEPGTDCVEMCEVEPSTSSQHYTCVSVDCDSEEPDSTCTSRKNESAASVSQVLDREATSMPQSLKSLLQYEESESETEPENVSASLEQQPVSVSWNVFEDKNSNTVDTSNNDIVSQPVNEANPSTSLEQSDMVCESQPSTYVKPKICPSSRNMEAGKMLSSLLQSQPSTSSSVDEPRQSTSSAPSSAFYLPKTNSPQDNTYVFDPGLNENDPKPMSSFGHVQLPAKGLPSDNRHGFGFNNSDSSDAKPLKQSTSSGCSGISFVRSTEVFELKKLNEDHNVLPKDSLNFDHDAVVSGCDNADVVRPSRVYEDDPEEEMDLDDIEKELDKALERKKNSTGAGTARNLEMPSTSRMSDQINREFVVPNSSPFPELNNSERDERDSLEALSADLLGKLKLLNTSHSHLPLLTLLLIMLETRHTDWQQGALSSQYFAARLQESSGVLRQYEETSTPAGWTCAWDRQLKKYYFIHEESGIQQFEFPTAMDEELTDSNLGELASTSSIDLSAHVLVGHSHSSAGQNPLVTSSTAEEFFRSAARNNSLNQPRMGQALSGSVSNVLLRTASAPEAPIVQPVVPPLPPSPPPPVTPPPAPPKSPPPPPDSTELKEDYDIMVGMDVEDSNSKESSSDANPSSSSGSSAIPARQSVKAALEGAPLPSSDCLEQEQVAFYESLGNSAAQTSFTNAGVVVSTAAVITRPPQTISCPSATAVSTSEIPPQLPQDSSFFVSAPTTWKQPPTDFSRVSESDSVTPDIRVGSPRPSVLSGLFSLTSSAQTVSGSSGPIAGPSGLSGSPVAGPSGLSALPIAGPSGLSGSSIAGPSGLPASFVAGSSGITASFVAGPSGLSVASVAGPSGLGSVEMSSNLCVPGPSGVNDSIAAVPGPSNSSGEGSGTSKKDRKKTKLSSGLSMKKKNISSLVQKWQKIKKEQLLEEGLAQNERRSADRDDKKNSDQDGKISTTM